MYARQVQLANYGPIEKLDIELPFEGELPKPVVFVGENGSGKSILLSHIVNGLVAAKNVVYPETPEVELDRVYKLRSNSYIKTASEYSFGRVDFDQGFFVSELRVRSNKEEPSNLPTGVAGTAAEDLWNKLTLGENDYFDSNFTTDPSITKPLKDMISKSCAVYFPFNRFEEPAWLNEDNLKAQAQYMDIKRVSGYTNRKLLAYSPLRDNQDWLFDLVYDRAAFEMQTQSINFPSNDSSSLRPLSVFMGYSGDAARAYEAAVRVVRVVIKKPDVRFGIGMRSNRVVSIESEAGQVVPNIFQLSSGETSLLDLFLSVLRDFDLCRVPFSSTTEIPGIVVVDEIDLHLHAHHQYGILPQLIQMFPRVQFVVTTHSPLFVLGMAQLFGEGGFGLYKMPQGQRISPEEFGEFGSAYESFTKTQKFSDDVKTAIQYSQLPIVLLEGATDVNYVVKAANMFGHQKMFQKARLQDGGGAGNLVNVWKNWRPPLADMLPQKVLLLFDCDQQRADQEKGNLFQRTVPFCPGNPVKTGIENLFNIATLSKARRANPAFFIVSSEYTKVSGEETNIVPEEWMINDDEKSNLCTWLCENGTEEDFQAFGQIFELLKILMDSDSEQGATW